VSKNQDSPVPVEAVGRNLLLPPAGLPPPSALSASVLPEGAARLPALKPGDLSVWLLRSFSNSASAQSPYAPAPAGQPLKPCSLRLPLKPRQLAAAVAPPVFPAEPKPLGLAAAAAPELAPCGKLSNKGDTWSGEPEAFHKGKIGAGLVRAFRRCDASCLEITDGVAMESHRANGQLSLPGSEHPGSAYRAHAFCGRLPVSGSPAGILYLPLFPALEAVGFHLPPFVQVAVGTRPLCGYDWSAGDDFSSFYHPRMISDLGGQGGPAPLHDVTGSSSGDYREPDKDGLAAVVRDNNAEARGRASQHWLDKRLELVEARAN